MNPEKHSLLGSCSRSKDISRIRSNGFKEREADILPFHLIILVSYNNHFKMKSPLNHKIILNLLNKIVKILKTNDGD